MRALRDRVATSAQYYRLTGDSFRALCPEASGHMNMGLWPARSLREAQERLVGVALARAAAACRASVPAPRGILDLGSGWGGSRALFHAAFPGTPYIGVNVSGAQVAVARALNARVPDTEYIVAAVEEVARLPWDRVDLLFSIEAAFHFEGKERLFVHARRRGVRLVTLLEICVEDPSLADDPLLAPSLGNAWSTARYAASLAEAGFDRVTMEDLGAAVFPGFRDHLEALGETSYRGRRAILGQLRRAGQALARAAEEGRVRYILLTARPSAPPGASEEG